MKLTMHIDTDVFEVCRDFQKYLVVIAKNVAILNFHVCVAGIQAILVTSCVQSGCKINFAETNHHVKNGKKKIGRKKLL